MKTRTSINSKSDPTSFLKRGFKSMFCNYGIQPAAEPPLDTNKKSHKALSEQGAAD
ncbi:hypothetical protein PSDVSF_10120 [Pseudodesulfovibrio sediminis]|uniref:Uncharacterized protein n=1 Tax=Pseudodesulfovibrio sediminis TaxID=2810563 RepID=A0ABM7P4J7_9BACT|nr:hypothetical protein PSDVSF_10120 [Pseudodesulfovibrio sediminis]